MFERLHGRRRQVLSAAVLAVAALLAGRWLASAGTPAERPLVRAPVRVTSTAAQAPLVVDVVGAVRRPGLYRLPAGSRVADALARAGGATSHADTALVNLAAPLADGIQIAVPRRGSAAASTVAGAPGSAGGSSGPVHLNSASVADLDTLPGIGPVTTELRLPPTTRLRSSDSTVAQASLFGRDAASLPRALGASGGPGR